MELNSTQGSEKTTIQLRKATVGGLTECKHGNDTYDDVINKLMTYHHDKTGSTIVE